MATDLIQPCRTMTDLQGCLEADSHCVPTVEFAVRNIDLPLDVDSYNFLAQPEINVFSQQNVNNTRASNYATSRNLTDSTLTFDVPFVLLGLCVYAYGDPEGITIEGNQFGPTSNFAVNGQLPASPINLRNVAALQSGLVGGATPFTSHCPAQINWGNPTWNAIWAFMHAYRLVMKCPSSSYELLLDESLADIGNCCSQTEWSGFGSAKDGHILYSRKINDRLVDAAIQNGQSFGQTGAAIADPGQFVPLNSEQFADGTITPQRYVADFANHGRPISLPAVEQWYRLPCPIPFPAIPQPKLKVSLVRATGDDGYYDRMLQEMAMFPCMNPVGGLNSSNFPINEPDLAVPAVINGGYGGMTRIPGGQIRIGIGLKGFEVRPSVCEDLMGMLAGKTFPYSAPAGRQQQAFAGKGVCMPFGLTMGAPEGAAR